MTMKGMRIGLLGAVVTTSLIVPLALAHHSQVKMRERSEMLRQKSERVAELSAENQRLSKELAKNDSSFLTSEQLTELMKLRGEIGRLRQAAGEIDKLRATNQQLLAACERTKTGADPSAPDPQAVQAHWAKDQLGFAAYVDPTSALKSALWAMSLGDADALAASVTPEAKAALAHEGWYDRRSPGEEIADSARKVADSLGPANGFSVVTQKMVSEELAILGVYFEGEGQTRRIAMKKVGDEWKFSVMGRAGDSDDDLQNGYGVWP
jgi:hypothetical protein